MAIAKKTYEFTEARWFLNTFYQKGDRDQFFAKQVEHEGHSIVEVKDEPKAELKRAKAPAASQA